MSDKDIKIYQVKDDTDNYVIKKDKIPNLPHRCCLIGSSGSGKTSTLVNLYCNPDFYLNDFDGEDIFIVSGSLKNDEKLKKLIKFKEIPASNLMDKYNEDKLQVVYDMIKEDFHEAVEKGEKPKHTLIILDDISFTGHLKDKQAGVISELVCNSRKVCCSLCFTSQKYSHLSTCVRNNCNFGIFFNTTDKELELISTDFNYNPSKKKFMEEFRKCTNKKHGTFIVRMDKDRKDWYTSDFNDTIDL